jgi:hypothetical protein
VAAAIRSGAGVTLPAGPRQRELRLRLILKDERPNRDGPG